MRTRLRPDAVHCSGPDRFGHPALAGFFLIAVPVRRAEPLVRNQDFDEIADVRFELVVIHARLADLRELDEADVGGIG